MNKTFELFRCSHLILNRKVSFMDIALFYIAFKLCNDGQFLLLVVFL